MNLLLDTHVVIWSLSNSRFLPEHIREMILSPDNEIFVSAASIWELSVKHAKHPSNVPYIPEEVLQYCHEAGYELLSIDENDAIRTETLQIHKEQYVNQDPFDRMLIAQAKGRGMKLLTHDSVMQYYSESCILRF